ncbi:hypothetical protein AB1Y20_020769 [Prymnesium parvum]|uniref:Uncharacterized protein n=1 Tax=Prymnesium parvum TaxID=97485 RepID=A0AB34JY58_PRYPA|mmetsp:Transcript_20197/g.46344  ORF Transcript_20197/g.46344 Transcript_20197/m.46344 type:complete len:115 (+) Transcript_20197:143-487(+)
MQPLSRTVPPGLHKYRGPNHVLVSRRHSLRSLHARVRKLWETGRWDEVHLHGLGAAISQAIVLAAALEESDATMSASASTSTELLVDRDAQGEGVARYNSAIHVCLRRRSEPRG